MFGDGAVAFSEGRQTMRAKLAGSSASSFASVIRAV